MLKRTRVEGNRGTHSENPVGFLLRTAPGVAPFAWLAPSLSPEQDGNLPVVFYPSQLRCIPSRNGTAAAAAVSLTVTVTALHLLNVFLASLWLRQSLHAMVRCACARLALAPTSQMLPKRSLVAPCHLPVTQNQEASHPCI